MSSSKTRKILNGIVGDYLDATKNELAIEMAFYCNGKQIVDFSGMTEKRVCILVHGLVDDESRWTDGDMDYGLRLQQDVGGINPLYLRYNTGLHISTNGHKLNRLLKWLLKSHEHSKIDEIVFLCHSMGGLVVRSACTYGLDDDADWIKRVGRVIFLGTPHQGSYWEKLGNIISNGLGSIPLPYMQLAAQVSNLRSAGIKDLRFGYVRDNDWQNDNDALLHNTKTKAALLNWVSYHVVTGSITQNTNHPLSMCFGDGLVWKSSAQGYSKIDEHHLPFESLCEFSGVTHNGLVCNDAVYQQIKEWIAQPNVAPEEVTNCSDITDEEKQEKLAFTLIPGKYDLWKGSTKLVTSTVGAGVTAVGQVHREMTTEVYSIVLRCKLFSPVVTKIQVVHETAIDGVYGIISTVSHGLGEAAKHVIHELEKMDHNLE